jgi:hypothetical protein
VDEAEVPAEEVVVEEGLAAVADAAEDVVVVSKLRRMEKRVKILGTGCEGEIFPRPLKLRSVSRYFESRPYHRPCLKKRWNAAPQKVYDSHPVRQSVNGASAPVTRGINDYKRMRLFIQQIMLTYNG